MNFIEGDESGVLRSIAARQAFIHQMRKIVGFIFLLGAIYSVKNEIFWPILLTLAIAWIVTTFMSVKSANEVQNATGLSHKDQAALWQKYKSDQSFRASIDILMRKAWQNIEDKYVK